MADEEKKHPAEETAPKAVPAAGDVASAATNAFPGGLAIPPAGISMGPGGIPPQIMALQLGIGMQQQQNPEVMRHMTEFLAHDSDNRLKGLESSGSRNHQFRMTALCVGTGIFALVVGVPLVVQLFRGDMTFVDKLLRGYLPVIGAVILALFAGPKVSEFFKG
jgi:hypothetical protein